MTDEAARGGREESVRRVVDRLRGSRRVILTTHVNADGDGAGCEVALRAWLRTQGAEAWIVNPTPFPGLFRFLLEDPSGVVDPATDDAGVVCGQADLAVVLDTGEVPRVGRVKPLIDDLDTVIVDHHQPGDQPIPGLSLRDPEACATGELLFDVIDAADGPWPQVVVDGLYVAILTDTGSFRFSNATPRAHAVAASLIERGADPEQLHREVYGASPLRAFRLLEASLATLEVDPEGKVAWMTVPREAYDDLGAAPEDLEGLVDYPRSVQGVEVGILFRQTATGDTKISFRSNGSVDVNGLARSFGGGGHIKAAGALLPTAPEEAIPEVVEATLKAVRESEAGGDG